MKNGIKGLFIILLLISSGVWGQRIMGYFPSYRNAVVGNVEFQKMTDVIFAFMNFDPATGNLDLTNQPQLNNLIAASRALNPNIRIHISSGGGGYGGGGQFPTLINNAVARNNFVTQMANLIQSNNLDGWDLDWEYPQTTAEKNNQETLVTAMKNALNAKETVMCKELDVSIAVGALMHTSPPNTWNVNANTMNFVDHVLIMAYDGGPGVPGDPHHSSYQFAQEALDGWNAWGLPYSKMVLGVPFYGWIPYFAGAQTYAGIAPGNQAAVFNADLYNGYYYNGAPTLRNKIDLAMRPGRVTGGIMIWELGQDVFGGPYSLLNAVHQKFITSYTLSGLPPNPCALPVEFIHKSAVRNEATALVEWTVRERDNNYFAVEKSLDAINFETIAELKSVSGAGINSYQVADEEIIRGSTVYYRVVQYDLNGTSTTSETIRLDDISGFRITLYPQPAEDEITVMIETPEFNQAYMVVEDATGKNVLTAQLNAYENQVSLACLMPGLYVAQINIGTTVFTRKITKL